ncbi:MAG TPA: hypothetical protein VMB46_08215 [Methanomassiliicoccales archaeon]|nr:hypothetical protein [Methanomassiliicoccales archaeon]
MSPDLLRLSASEGRTRPRAKVVGIGGAGCNVVSDSPLPGIAVCREGERPPLAKGSSPCHLTTDHVKLFKTTAPQMLGTIAGNLRDGIFSAIGEGDMIFLFAGLGGETGSHVTPALANICRRHYKLVVASAALPFSVEGSERHYLASQSMEKLLEHSDLVLTYANDSLLKIVPNLPLRKAFAAMDVIMMAPVIDLISVLTTEDLTQLRADFSGSKRVRAGIGIAGGMDREPRAVEEAFSSPWFDINLDQVRCALVIVTSSDPDPKSEESIARNVSFRLPNARVRYGSRKDPEMGEKVRVMVLVGIGVPRP